MPTTACLKGVLPKGAGVGVGQLAGTEVPVATTGHIRYVVDVQNGETRSWTFIVNNRPLTARELKWRTQFFAFQSPYL
jgi:hypothetical protein